MPSHPTERLTCLHTFKTFNLAATNFFVPDCQRNKFQPLSRYPSLGDELVCEVCCAVRDQKRGRGIEKLPKHVVAFSPWSQGTAVWSAQKSVVLKSSTIENQSDQRNMFEPSPFDLHCVEFIG